MEALVVSTAIVTVAEIGDKTQLLSFVLAAKLKRRSPIILGILVATLANHFLAGWVGVWLATLVSAATLRWIIAASFMAFGLWALRPDELEERALPAAGVFGTTAVTFFLVEMGDKTQLATMALAARYDALVSVVLGTTLGMMLANVPAVWMGEALAQHVNMKWMRWVAAALFLLLGALTLLAGDGRVRSGMATERLSGRGLPTTGSVVPSTTNRPPGSTRVGRQARNLYRFRAWTSADGSNHSFGVIYCASCVRDRWEAARLSGGGLLRPARRLPSSSCAPSATDPERAMGAAGTRGALDAAFHRVR
jgi:putative Ca2+/H+ antiporter (TMEM165/GDT1 family)